MPPFRRVLRWGLLAFAALFLLGLLAAPLAIRPVRIVRSGGSGRALLPALAQTGRAFPRLGRAFVEHADGGTQNAGDLVQPAPIEGIAGRQGGFLVQHLQPLQLQVGQGFGVSPGPEAARQRRPAARRRSGTSSRR